MDGVEGLRGQGVEREGRGAGGGGGGSGGGGRWGGDGGDGWGGDGGRTKVEPSSHVRFHMAGHAFLPWRRGGAEVEPSGTEVEPSWNPGGTKPALKILETLPARHARPAF